MGTATLFRRIKRLERSIPVTAPATTPETESLLPQIVRRLTTSIANLDVCESARLIAEDKLIDQSIEAIRQFYDEHSGFRLSAQIREEIRTAFDGADEVRHRFATRLLAVETQRCGNGTLIESAGMR